MFHRRDPEQRELLRTSGLGLIAVAFSGPLPGFAAPAVDRRRRRLLYQKPGQRGNVSLVKRENIFRSLKLIENDLGSGVGNRPIPIKANFVQISGQMAATHVNAIRAILDTLRPHYKQEILDGKSAAPNEGTTDDSQLRGTPVDSRFAIASVAPIGADTLDARGKGFDPKKVLDLASMAEPGMGQGDFQQVRVLGTGGEDCLLHFAPSSILKSSAVQEPETRLE